MSIINTGRTVQSDWNESDTANPSYIQNKPAIPTVNDATLTIQRNGTQVATFTSNASSNVTANVIVPKVKVGSTEVATAVTVTFSTSDPSGGSNGDIWFKYEA